MSEKSKIKGYVVQWDGPDGQVNEVSDETIEDAARSRYALMIDGDVPVVRILAVLADGTETPLPTYEETLAQIGDAHAVLDEVVARRDAIDGPALPLPVRAATAAKIVADLAQRSEEALAEVERLREEVAGWKDQASANAHGAEERRAFQEAAERERDEALAEVARLRACPLAALVRTFRGDPASTDSRGPVWTAFDRVVAALVEAVEDLRFALDVRLRQRREALDARDAMLAEAAS